jgi:hypothetical protein
MLRTHGVSVTRTGASATMSARQGGNLIAPFGRELPSWWCCVCDLRSSVRYRDPPLSPCSAFAM